MNRSMDHWRMPAVRVACGLLMALLAVAEAPAQSNDLLPGGLYRSSDPAFQIEFPKEFEHLTRTVEMVDNGAGELPLTMISGESDEGFAAVVYLPIDGSAFGDPATIASMFDEMRDQVLTQMGGTLGSEERSRVYGEYGRTIRFTMSSPSGDDAWGRIDLVASEPYVYQVLYATTASASGGRGASDAYFKSFIVSESRGEPLGVFRSPDGLFAVVFPERMEQPEQSSEEVETDAGAMTMHTAIATGEADVAMISWTEFPPDAFESGAASAVINGALEGALAQLDAEVLREEERSVGGHPARSVHFSGRGPQGDGIHGRIDMVLARPFFYQLLYASERDGDVEDEAVRFFFDSFGFTRQAPSQ